jgi:uncharacterized protein (DUF1697 family)
MAAYVSLFRGINVGGNHPVQMDALKELHQSLGLRDVRTHIQSGNVIFTSDEDESAQLAKHIEDRFEQRFGFHSEVMVRSASELQEINASNPFKDQQDKKTNWIVVMFLKHCPDATAQQDLLASYAGPEEIRIIGKEAHIYYPEGIGRSKLSGAYVEKKLKILGTARNWNTVTKLLEMMRAGG